MTCTFACSPIHVTRDYDSGTDFSRYHTFKWVQQDRNPPPARRAEWALLEKRVKSAVEAGLEKKGFRKADGRADILVAWHLGTEDKVNVERYGYRYGPRGRWYGTSVEVHHYKEGTLIIDFVDPGERMLVWRSTAVGSVRYFTKGEPEIQSTVEKMLEEFPPE